MTDVVAGSSSKPLNLVSMGAGDLHFSASYPLRNVLCDCMPFDACLAKAFAEECFPEIGSLHTEGVRFAVGTAQIRISSQLSTEFVVNSVSEYPRSTDSRYEATTTRSGK